jgi:hypothetical protein
VINREAEMGGVHNKHGMKNEYSYKVLFEELGMKRPHRKNLA